MRRKTREMFPWGCLFTCDCYSRVECYGSMSEPSDRLGSRAKFIHEIHSNRSYLMRHGRGTRIGKLCAMLSRKEMIETIMRVRRRTIYGRQCISLCMTIIPVWLISHDSITNRSWAYFTKLNYHQVIRLSCIFNAYSNVQWGQARLHIIHTVDSEMLFVCIPFF